MTRKLVAALVLACTPFAALAQTPPAAGPNQQYDVPNKPSYVAILTREFAPGQMAGRHIHHGVEMTNVIRGDLELIVDGLPNKVYHAGESFMVAREVPHDAKNVGTTPALISVTYVNDKGAALRDPVPEKK